MLFIGAGGIASQLFDDLVLIKENNFVFWSETGTKFSCISDHFKILRTDSELRSYFSNTSRLFAAGIWDIDNRKRLIEKFEALGGERSSFISPANTLSSYTHVGKGTIILNQAASEPDVFIGENCIINKRANFGHGCRISNFCSIGPYTIIASDAAIGEGSYVGMGAIIQPKVILGKNTVIAAGAVVSRNIPDNAVVSGVPAKIRFLKKQ